MTGAASDKEPSKFEARRRFAEELKSDETPRRFAVDPASIPKAGKYWSHDDRYL
jgi:hypothetical protein